MGKSRSVGSRPPYIFAGMKSFIYITTADIVTYSSFIIHIMGLFKLSDCREEVEQRKNYKDRVDTNLVNVTLGEGILSGFH